jgi:hypothetical protein
MKILIIIVLAFISCQVPAQQKDQKPVSRKKADAYFFHELYSAALPGYLYELRKDPENGELNLKAGVCLLYSGHKSESIPYLEKAIQKGVSDAYLWLGQAYHAQNQIDLALSNYLLYKKNAPVNSILYAEAERHIDISLRAREMQKKPVRVDIENLGPGINSSSADYVPLVSADESLLIFTSRREGSTGGYKDHNGHYFEDLYFSTRENNIWTPAANMGGTVNTSSHDASVGLSADGQKLIIYKMSEGSYGGDLYLSALSGQNWEAPRPIDGEINSPYWEPSACFSADNNFLFFSSDRPGGYGGRDIWLSKKLPDGTWGKPVNLGGIINTPFDDDAPFFHPDGKTLYFSSKGHSTMGGFDIFHSVMQPDNGWSIPENVGYPINTVDDDIYFVLSADGKHAYYSSDREGGLGDKDIYMIEMPDEAVPVIVIKGIISDEKSAKPVNARIIVTDEATKEVQGIYNSNDATGKFLIILPPLHTYNVRIEADNYKVRTEQLNFSEGEEFREISKDFSLKSN